jgi:hypothetical protein
VFCETSLGTYPPVNAAESAIAGMVNIEQRTRNGRGMIAHNLLCAYLRADSQHDMRHSRDHAASRIMGSRRATLVECTNRLDQALAGGMLQSDRTRMFADREMVAECYVTFVIAGNMAARTCSPLRELFSRVVHNRTGSIRRGFCSPVSELSAGSRRERLHSKSYRF